MLFHITVWLCVPALLSAWTIFDRLFLHPLSKFPGPKLAAATGLYETYFDIFVKPWGQFMFKIKSLHDEYGPVVRISPDEVHILDSNFLHKLYPKFQDGERWNKDPRATQALGLPFGLTGTSSGYVHRRRRQAIEKLFSTGAIDTTEAMIHKHARKLVEQVVDFQEESKDGFVDIRTLFLGFATTIINEHCVGSPSELLQVDKPNIAEEWYQTISSLTHMAPLARQCSWIIPYALRLPQSWAAAFSGSLARVIKLHKEMRELAEDAAEKFEASSTQSDFKCSKLLWYILRSAGLRPVDKTCRRMEHEALTILGAGGETTAQILTTAMFYILRNPDVLERLKKELNTLREERPHWKKIKKLEFLTAIVKETLRLVGVLTSRSPIVVPDDIIYSTDDKIYKIPAGTTVSMTYRYYLHHGDVYDKPEEFNPLRWFEKDKMKLERMNSHFVPFGIGARNCIGQELAWAEIYICLFHIFQESTWMLHGETQERDVRIIADCVVGAVEHRSRGVRVRCTGSKPGVN